MLPKRGAEKATPTLGERGSLLATETDSLIVPARRVKAVDSTDAGDALMGGLAYFLPAGNAIAEAMRRADRTAAIGV